MGLAAELVGKIKGHLRERGITYRDLAQRLGISEATLKRGFSQNIFTLERIEEICATLGLSLADLAKPEDLFPIEHLTDAQEEALAKDERAFAAFYLLLGRLTPEQICRHFEFEAEEMQGLLLRLDRLDLIRLHAGNRVETRIRQSFYWKIGGPLAERYHSALRQDFLHSIFRGEHEGVWVLSGAISPSSLETIRKKFTQVAADCRELIRLDSKLPLADLVNVTFLSAFRPWTLPVIAQFRRRTQLPR